MYGQTSRHPYAMLCDAWKESEHGLVELPASPQWKSQLRLGSVPTHEEPELAMRVLRHMRSPTHDHSYLPYRVPL